MRCFYILAAIMILTLKVLAINVMLEPPLIAVATVKSQTIEITQSAAGSLQVELLFNG
jgi:hypothetical protein